MDIIFLIEMEEIFILFLNYLRDPYKFVLPDDDFTLRELLVEAEFYCMENFVNMMKGFDSSSQIKILIRKNTLWDFIGPLKVTNTQETWSTVILEFAGRSIYLEMNILSHGGEGHIRIGIVNDNFDNSKYPGFDVNSLAIYPSNTVQGFWNGSLIYKKWNKDDRIGMFYDKDGKKIRFYHNAVFLVELEVPNGQWYPALCVHCPRDEMEIIKNPNIPNDITCNEKISIF